LCEKEVISQNIKGISLALKTHIINKLFNSIFTGQPITPPESNERSRLTFLNQFFTHLQDDLSDNSSIKIYFMKTTTQSHPFKYRHEIEICYQDIEEYEEDCFRIFFQEDKLQIQTKELTAYVNHENEVLQLMKSITTKRNLRDQKVQKKKKVNTLKKTFIETKIKSLSQEYQFSYRIQTQTNKIKLFIELDDQQEGIIDIPYHQFQNCIEKIGSLIHDIQKCAHYGMSFQIKTRITK